jgi:acetyl-CoA carboxylase, biotin carboxylase subunit
LAYLRHTLKEFVIEGIHTSICIHREIMRLPAFRDGHVDTPFIERGWQKKG